MSAGRTWNDRPRSQGVPSAATGGGGTSAILEPGPGCRHARLRRVLTPVLGLLLMGSEALGAQSEARGPYQEWSAGVGAAFGLACPDCQTPEEGVAVAVGFDRGRATGWRFGAAFGAAWMASDFSRQSRYELEATLARLGGGEGGPWIRLGTGPTLATVITRDGPPDPPGVGDLSVGIGDTMGWGASLAVGMRWPIGRGRSLAPEVRIHGQRVEGRWVTTGRAGILVVFR